MLLVEVQQVEVPAEPVMLVISAVCWCCVDLQYRTSHNYKDHTFLGARLGDKILMAL